MSRALLPAKVWFGGLGAWWAVCATDVVLQWLTGVSVIGGSPLALPWAALARMSRHPGVWVVSALISLGLAWYAIIRSSRPLETRRGGAMLGRELVLSLGLILTLECSKTLLSPVMEVVFRNFGIALPTLTRAEIWASRLVAGAVPGQNLPGIGAVYLMHLGWLVLLLRSRRGGGATGVRMMLVLGALGLAAIVVAAHGLPLLAMSRAMQGGRLGGAGGV